MLAAMFISAVFEFGKVDLIGHTLIVVVLLAIIADNGGKAALVRYPWLVPVGYAASVGMFLLSYYVAHTVLFGTSMNLTAAYSTFDVNDQLHFRMNGAQHVEGAGNRES